jgi:ketosteroid isomerase-like protein
MTASDLQRRWLDGERAGQMGAVLDLCTEDIVWMPPIGRALRGKPAILAWLDGLGGRIEDVILSGILIDGHGPIGYKVADYRTRWVPADSNRPIVNTGSHLWVLRRQADSSWRVALVAWSSCGEDNA